MCLNKVDKVVVLPESSIIEKNKKIGIKECGVGYSGSMECVCTVLLANHIEISYF